MLNQTSFKPDTLPKFEYSEFALNNSTIDNQVLISEPQHDDHKRENLSTNIRLNLEDLKCFEVVEYQYQDQGVVFSNSIAINPSNPAFPTRSGLVVLMGAPKSGFLEASFLHPVQSVSAFVTSSGRLLFSAYDRDRQMVTQTILASSNLANSSSAIPPNTLLFLRANNIHRVTFCSLDGLFTVDNFSFCF